MIPAFSFAEKTLFEAVTNGNVVFINHYQGDLNATNESGITALIYAAGNGETEMVDALIKRGADIDTVDEEGKTALLWASYPAINVHRDFPVSDFAIMYIVKSLIKAGADVNATDKYGWSVLGQAIDGGKTELVKVLIEDGVDVNLPGSLEMDKSGLYKSITPLKAAKSYYKWNTNYADIIKALTNAGGEDDPEKAYYILTGDNVRVRSAAGTNSIVLLSLNKNANVKLMNRSNISFSIGDKKGYWTLIDTGIDNRKKGTIKGWLIDYYLKEEVH